MVCFCGDGKKKRKVGQADQKPDRQHPMVLPVLSGGVRCDGKKPRKPLKSK